MNSRPPFLLRVYLVLARLAAPLYWVLHKIRVRRGKDEKVRGGEKFGHPGLPRPAGPVIWVHAASVGETNSVLPLIHELAARGYFVLLTTVTRTSAKIAARNLPEGAGHQFAPFDSPVFVERFLDNWRPDLAIFVESEIWPAILTGLKARHCRTVLVNGRLSARSYRGWSRLGLAAAHLFSHFDLILAQSRGDEERFRSIGSNTVVFAGNLKLDADLPQPDPEKLADMKAALDRRPVWLAALTHPGEDDVVLSAHKHILRSHPGSLLLIAPRHPERGADIAEAVRKVGLSYALRSAGELPGPQNQVYLCDTLGEMNLLYRSVPVAFLGGSFADVGGHNPVEAIKFRAALVSGPKVANARTLYRDLWSDDAALKVDKPDDLAAAICSLFENGDARSGQIARSLAIVDQGKGALARTMTFLGPLLPNGSKGGKE